MPWRAAGSGAAYKTSMKTADVLIDTEGVEPVSHLGIHILEDIVYATESAIVIQERREVVVEFI